MTSLSETYKKKVISAMRERFGYANVMVVPRLKKVVVNCGIGRIVRDKNSDEEVQKYLTMITGQKPVPCKARKSIASFKTRKGQVLGYKVTLRGRRMYDFIERVIGAAIPRMRDFRGISTKAVDHGGNLTIGVREHIIFPETIGEDYRTIFGLELTVVSSAGTRDEALELFRLLGFPIKREI